MKNAIRTLVLLALTSSWGMQSLAAQVPATSTLPLQASRAALVAWYATLDLPDTAGRPFVRVVTGGWSGPSGGPFEVYHEEGFLLSEDAASFTVFISGVGVPARDGRRPFGGGYSPLRVVRFVRRPDVPEHERVGYTRLDLRTAARDAQARVREHVAQLKWQERIGFDQTRIFLFACALLQNHLQPEADGLFELAELTQSQSSNVSRAEPPGEFKRNVAGMVLAGLEAEILDPLRSWSSILDGYRAYERHFPDIVTAAYRARIQDLQRMVTESRNHKAVSIQNLSPPERAAEWIFQLRDTPVSIDGWSPAGTYPAHPLDPKNDREKTPVHHLVDLGIAAIPALIAALDDNSFTKTRNPGRTLDGSVWPMRVSDIALEILQSMAGRPFRFSMDPGAGIRPDIEAWWAGVQIHGARQQLINDVAIGGKTGEFAARKLVQLYPESAIGPIERAARAGGTSVGSVEYVEIAASIPGESAMPFMRSLLTAEQSLPVQAIAARRLLLHGDRSAIPIMISRWREAHPGLSQLRLRPTPPGPPRPGGPPRGGQESPLTDVRELIAFLAHCGDPLAIAALSELNKQALPDIRLETVTVFLPRGIAASRYSGGFGTQAGSRKAEVNAAVERHLRAALADTTTRAAMVLGYEGKSIADPRICDVAAVALTSLWPERYAFDLQASTEARDAAINAMMR